MVLGESVSRCCFSTVPTRRPSLLRAASRREREREREREKEKEKARERERNENGENWIDDEKSDSVYSDQFFLTTK